MNKNNIIQPNNQQIRQDFFSRTLYLGIRVINTALEQMFWLDKPFEVEDGMSEYQATLHLF